MTAVVFDLFGVIAKTQSPAASARLEALAGVPGEAFWPAYWGLRPGYDAGECSGADYWRALGQRLGRDFSPASVRELIEADLDSWSEARDDTVQLLEQWHGEGVRLGLLSNIPRELAARYRAAARWLGLFEAICFSCDTGHPKPDALAFLDCAERLKSRPGEILFVDDRAENVAAARAVGMLAHQFTSVAALRAARDGWVGRAASPSTA